MRVMFAERATTLSARATSTSAGTGTPRTCAAPPPPQPPPTTWPPPPPPRTPCEAATGTASTATDPTRRSSTGNRRAPKHAVDACLFPRFLCFIFFYFTSLVCPRSQLCALCARRSSWWLVTVVHLTIVVLTFSSISFVTFDMEGAHVLYI